MKVILTNTRVFYSIVWINIVVSLLFFLINPGIAPGSPVYFLLLLEFNLLLVLILIYFIRVLMYLNERTSVIVAFTMYTGFLAISFLTGWVPSLLDRSYTFTINILTEVTSILVAFRSFKVKNALLSTPFRLFGVAIFLMSFSKLIVLMVIPIITNRMLDIYDGIIAFLALLAACYLLKRTITLLKSTEIQEVVH